MGSSFSKVLGGGIGSKLGIGLDPIGSLLGKVSGPNSWFAKMSAYDPLVSSPVGKVIEPNAYNLGQQYANRHNPQAGYQAPPTPYAGQAPTLAGANLGYVNAARAAGQQQGNQVNPYGS